MQRFFIPPESFSAEEIRLPPEIAHHLGTVLRRPVGEEVLILDGCGRVGRCRITALDRRSATAEVLDVWRETETAFPITLYQALPKGDKMELVLQKGTELGIAAFVPVLAGRSVAVPPPEREAARRVRWERIVREAARQCRRPVLPRLFPPASLPVVLGRCREELRLILWEKESRPLAELLPVEAPAGAAILVGPEGGWSEQEVATARAAGFRPVAFGPRILRSETAGFAVASILQYVYGDLGALSAPDSDRPEGAPHEMS